MQQRQEQWSTRIGVILAVAGSAVGIGNFLRFPGQAAENGGGVFMIPYFCALIFLGIPICWAEWTMGKIGGRAGLRSCPAILGHVGGGVAWRYVGSLGLLLPTILCMYYVVLESWCLAYAWHYLTGGINLGSDPAGYVANSGKFFNDTVGAADDGVMLDGRVHPSVWFWIITIILNFALIFRGISKGIERFCNIAMPIMLVCALIVLIRVLTLPAFTDAAGTRTVADGLGFMWNPRPAEPGGTLLGALADPKVWLAAAGQIFFTLSVGFGVISNYASYLKPKDDIALSGLTASATNEFFEVCLGGLITVPAAFLFLGLSGAFGSFFGLGFVTLPVVFQYMPLGNLFGFLWFFMLFLAAITSSLSLLQPVIAFLEEAFCMARTASVAVLGIITVLGGLYVIWFSKGLAALDTLDFWTANVGIFIFAGIEVVVLTWLFGSGRAHDVAMQGAELRIPRLVFTFIMRYVTPLYLLVVFVMWLFYKASGYIADLAKGGVPLMSVMLIGAVLLFYLVLIAAGGRRLSARSEVTP